MRSGEVPRFMEDAAPELHPILERNPGEVHWLLEFKAAEDEWGGHLPVPGALA